MQHNDIAYKFYQEIFRLSSLAYSESAVEQQSIYLRAAADKFIYRDTSVDLQNMIISRAKSSRMALPPWLHSVLDLDGVQDQVMKVLSVSKGCSTIAEMETALNKKSASSKEKADFDKLLKSFLATPKEDL